ncbi:hypothetical protein NM208_g15248 [Fusarium decemcellulare]|uniref:Uncharacterized protein n=1 Tax=Fusarium decemcellulare TaxID=57161 RepID=A0ACC1RG77_9HYPO|nr:hypothetical protein NM208_g15248 [Fusarium decemcellulare]
MATGVDARLLKSTKFPAEFSQKVDMQKVNLQVMKKWIAGKISDILGSEDDVVIELCFNLIEGPRYPDIKSLQIQLTGFLDKDTASFCKELWKLLLSAQGSPQGVPKELLEAKKLELMQEKIEADRAAETAKKRRDDWDRRDREVADLKERDRRDRAATQGEGGLGEEAPDHDLLGHASVTLGIPTDATAMFREVDGEEAAPALAEEGHLFDRLRNQPHLDRPRAAVVRHAVPIDQTAGVDPSRPEDGETSERDPDRQGVTHTEAVQTAAMIEDGRPGHLGLHHPTGDLLRLNVGATLLLEAVR